MKKIYLLAASVMMGAISFGQNWDIETILTSPASGSTVPLQANDTYAATFTFKNNGPDAVPATDTAYFAVINVTQGKLFSLIGGTENGVNLLPMSALGAGGWTSGLSVASSALSITSVKFPGAQVGDVVLIGCLGIGDISLENEDPNDTNNDNNFDSFMIGTAGLEKIDFSTFSVYPNPATETITVTAQEPVASVKVLSMNGSVVASAEGATVNVADLKAGAYIYHATTISGKNVANKFVKK